VLVCARLTSSKKVDMRHTPVLELSLFFLTMYMPFFIAELFELSGIVTILFTGISARRYASGNLSDGTEENVDILFRLAAHIAETSIFLELGLSVFGLTASLRWKFVGWSILACLIGRALNIYPLRTIHNIFLLRNTPKEELDAGLEIVSSIISSTPCTRKDLKVRNNTAHMLWFSGLRGAVAYACAKTFPNVYGKRSDFVSTTTAIVFFTVFTFGCTTEWALKKLGIEMNCDEELYMEKNKTVDKMNHINKFENDYIYPHVIRNYSLNNEKDVTVQNMSAVTDTKQWVNPAMLSPGSTSRSAYFQNYDECDNDANTRRFRNHSLYDYGMGASMRSVKTDSLTNVNVI